MKSGLVNPLPDSVPWFDHGPPAVQLTAPEELQVRVARLPETTGFGEAVSEDTAALADGILMRKNNDNANEPMRENRLKYFIICSVVYSILPISLSLWVLSLCVDN